MRALFVSPLPFTGVGGNSVMAGSVENLNDDTPGLVWRGATQSSFTIDLGPDPVEYDTVALIGTNLRAGDSVRVSTLTAIEAPASYASGWEQAWTGTKPKKLTAKTIIRLPSVRTERFIKVAMTATNHPSGYVQAQRLVIGKAVSTLGIKFGAKMNFEDNSVITKGPGFTSIDRYQVLPSWEISTTGISDLAWRTEWAPLLLEAGSSAGILFVRDEQAPATWQTDAIFGRIVSKAYGEASAYDYWVFSGTIEAFAP